MRRPRIIRTVYGPSKKSIESLRRYCNDSPWPPRSCVEGEVAKLGNNSPKHVQMPIAGLFDTSDHQQMVELLCGDARDFAQGSRDDVDGRWRH